MTSASMRFTFIRQRKWLSGSMRAFAASAWPPADCIWYAWLVTMSR